MNQSRMYADCPCGSVWIVVVSQNPSDMPEGQDCFYRETPPNPMQDLYAFIKDCMPRLHFFKTTRTCKCLWDSAIFAVGGRILKLVSNQTFKDHNICTKSSLKEKKRAGLSLKPMKKQVVCLCLLLKQLTSFNDDIFRLTTARAERALISALQDFTIRQRPLITNNL